MRDDPPRLCYATGGVFFLSDSFFSLRAVLSFKRAEIIHSDIEITENLCSVLVRFQCSQQEIKLAILSAGFVSFFFTADSRWGRVRKPG